MGRISSATRLPGTAPAQSQQRFRSSPSPCTPHKPGHQLPRGLRRGAIRLCCCSCAWADEGWRACAVATGWRGECPGRRLNGEGVDGVGGRRTYRVVLEHAHGRRRSRARELVEEARHGHREEPHRDDTGFHCSHTRVFSQCCWREAGGESFRGCGAPFLAMACCEGCRGRWEYGCGRRPRATGEVLILGIG